MKRILQVLLPPALMAMALAIAPAAQATTTYTLNVDYCSTGCLFGGTGGTISLQQNGSNDVTVTVNLSTVDFHGFAGLTSFVWNLGGLATGTVVTIANLAGDGGGTWSSSPLTSVHEDGAGTFGYGVNCSTCGPQSGGVDVTSISFDVLASGLTEASFNFLSSGGSPSAYFAASVFNPDAPNGGSCTGVIGADGNSTPENGGSNTGNGLCGGNLQQTPEPHSLALAGLGLLVAGFARRKTR